MRGVKVVGRIYDLIEKHVGMQSAHLLFKKIYVCSDASARQRCKDYYTHIIQRVIWIILTSAILTLVVIVLDLRKSQVVQLKRPGYGQDSIGKTIKTEVDGKNIDIGIDVLPIEYDEAGLKNAFDKTGEYLDTTYLGENESADSVCRNLNLVTYQEEYGIEIRWLSSDYNVVTGDGKVIVDDPEMEKLVELTAVLTYGEESVERKYPIRIVGTPLSASELAQKKIANYIYNLQISHGDSTILTLPENIEGYEIRGADTGSRGGAIIIVGIAVSTCLLVAGRTKLKKQVKDRKNELMSMYPEFVESLSMYLRAGITVRNAMNRIVDEQTNDSILQREIRYALNEIRAGVSESEAYYHMGHRVGIPIYIKTMSLLSQNVKKGTRDLLLMMESEEQSALQVRKEIARKKGEEAGTKLLFPMMILLGVVMLIVILPAVISF